MGKGRLSKKHRRSAKVAARATSASRPTTPPPTPSTAPPEDKHARGLALLDHFDNHAGLRHALHTISVERGWHAGVPMPLADETLVIEPSYPKAAELMAMGAKSADEVEPERAKIRNIFWSWRWKCDIIIGEEDGKIVWGKSPGAHHFDMDLRTLGCQEAWGIEQESKAVALLGTLVRHRQLKQYLLTGMFLEKSKRGSGVTYCFRRLRPTVALPSPDRILFGDMGGGDVSVRRRDCASHAYAWGRGSLLAARGPARCVPARGRPLSLCQFFTPVWVAEALIERHFPRLDVADHVLEPSCGPGAFLHAVPRSVLATGVEIDPLLAQFARDDTGREVITGDFRTVPIGFTPTAIIGNPPFRASVFDAFLQRAYALLPEGARAAFILPSYFFQTASRVVGYSDRWSLKLEMMPRNAFHSRMRTPLVFALFTKDRRSLMVGFALYHEADGLLRMARQYRDLLSIQQGSAWRAVCRLALERLGGVAELPAIYAELENNRPSRSVWWREKIRQTLRVYSDFVAIQPGRYALRQRAAA